MPPVIPGAPADIAAAIEELVTELTRSAGPNLAGLILYGGLARGRFRAGRSDVNVVVLLRNASRAGLSDIAPALAAARRSAGVEPMILTPREVSEAADVFPTKFLDIQRYHIVLAGEDPFANLEISREHVRLRIELELRNMLLRLRRLGLDAIADLQLMARSLRGASRPLAIELEALLRIADKPAPPDDHTSSIFAAAATAFDLNPTALARLADLREQPQTEDDLTGLYDDLLSLIAQAADIADRMKDPS